MKTPARCLVTILALFSFAAQPSAHAFSGHAQVPKAAPTTCDGTWRVQTTPNPSSTGDVLAGVWAASTTDVWAVGYRFNPEKGLAFHYDGSSWTSKAVPTVGNNSHLLSVWGASKSSIWAVGWYINGSGVRRTLVLHYDGSAWAQQSSPNSGTHDNLLLSIHVGSAQTWAVGWYQDGTGTQHTLILQYTGGKWVKVTSPNIAGANNVLQGVRGVSSTFAWAVGFSLEGNGTTTPLFEQWNGSSWNIVASTLTGVRLNAVSAKATNDAIAGGEDVLATYDGASWKTVDLGLVDWSIYGVAGGIADGAWAVGGRQTGVGTGPSLIVRWDGSVWSIVSSPSKGVLTVLNSVSKQSGHAWAVGFFTDTNGSAQKTIIEHYC
jgi:hypothetical protein